jgi:phosphatidylglycerol:prolipoprotein diacylglycerol transferase
MILKPIFDFFHNYHPQPVIFRLGFLSFHWYGFLLVISILIGLFLTINLAKKKNIKSEKIFDLSIYLIFFGFIGARVYHILSEINYYTKSPLEIFYIWQGGLGIFGAFIAGIIVIYIFSLKNKIPFLTLIDLIIPSFVLGEAIGRWGNWFNQENFGKPTNSFFGIPIEWKFRPLEYLSNEYFHPTFLYQSLYNFLLFVFLIFLIKKKEKFIGTGKIFAFYLIFYSLGRFFIEFIRINYQPIILGLRLAQFICLIMFISGIFLFKFSSKNSQNIHRK